jgi:hypothetical protein
MTPMTTCAESVASDLLRSSGRTAVLAIAGHRDELASWCRRAFGWVDDPTTIEPPPLELIQLCRKTDRTPEEQRTALACELAVLVWSIVDEELSLVLETNAGEGATPEEQRAARQRALTSWLVLGPATTQGRVDAALATAVTKVLRSLIPSS